MIEALVCFHSMSACSTIYIFHLIPQQVNYITYILTYQWLYNIVQTKTKKWDKMEKKKKEKKSSRGKYLMKNK